MDRIITYSLQENFIENLADFVEKNYIRQGKDISRLAFVFGGKRPSLFLKKELSRRIKMSFLAPRFFSIDEFIEYIVAKQSPCLKISDLDAGYIIYNLAHNAASDILKGRESFSRFLPWAREILSFIEQLDLEDIKDDALKNIQEKARIGYDVPENINSLLKSVIYLRKVFHEVLKKQGICSRGSMYLSAAGCIGEAGLEEFDQVIFCGFFYLHKTEETIIKHLYDTKKATLIFQGSAKNWSVLDKLAREFSVAIEPGRDVPAEYNLSVMSGFDAHSEACLVRETLKKIKSTDNTVVVLPESDNIIPVLSEISGCAKDFNVSMGYPLSRSSLYSLFVSIFKAQSTAKDGRYYTKDYLRVLSHHLMKNLKLLPNPSFTRVLVHKIEEILVGMEKTALGGSLFVRLSDIEGSRELFDLALITMKKMEIEAGWEDIKKSVEQLHELLFGSWENLHDFYGFSLSLEKLLDVLVRKSLLGNYPLNLKMAEKIFAIKQEFNSSGFNKEPFSKEDIFRIFENKLESEMISFSGSPLKGLQILGLFETRLLSFENVIVMDVNESVLPKLKIYEPLIPREVMISLGLNRLEKEEEIQRYQFRRLISCARNVYLIYQAKNDREKSRFIEELVWERQKQTNSLEVLSVPKASFKVKVLPKVQAVKKDKEIAKFLENSEFSASGVNTYLHCPLRFYYQYVLGLRRKEDLLDEPEGADIGTFIHELLKDTFAKFVGRRPLINAEFKKEFFARLEEKFSDEFSRKMKSDSFLIKEILDVRMERFLENEKKREVKEIICLEKVFKGQINLSGRNFRFKAIIDRIDRLSDDSLLILDYKSGGTNIMPVTDIEKIESAGFSRESLKNTVKSFQLPIYLYLLDNQDDYRGKRTNACLYFIKDLEKDQGLSVLFRKEEQLANKDKIMQVYLKALAAIFDEILDPGVDFKADEDQYYQCGTCPFFYLCR
ncbi:MAG: PD-(D/E)XK nuclease family protein [Candidatus Omnitrophica bacterium]|nr:PD-(D/E)XK nuclease family protein [Candidatus Omnitrophota bacterium]